MAEWVRIDADDVPSYEWSGNAALFLWLGEGSPSWAVFSDSLIHHHTPDLCPADTPPEEAQRKALAWARRVLTAARDKIDGLLAGELAEEAT